VLCVQLTTVRCAQPCSTQEERSRPNIRLYTTGRPAIPDQKPHASHVNRGEASRTYCYIYGRSVNDLNNDTALRVNPRGAVSQPCRLLRCDRHDCDHAVLVSQRSACNSVGRAP
jgi:hypothetical protein